MQTASGYNAGFALDKIVDRKHRQVNCYDYESGYGCKEQQHGRLQLA